MKKWIALAVLVCAPGSYLYKDVCVVDLQPQQAEPVKPSDERPPSEKLPSWQRDGVTVLDAPNKAEEDRKLDLEKAQADSQGKRSAGIK